MHVNRETRPGQEAHQDIHWHVAAKASTADAGKKSKGSHNHSGMT